MCNVQDLRFQSSLKGNFHSLENLFEYMMMPGHDLLQGEIAMDYKDLLHFSIITSVSLAQLLLPQPYFPMSVWHSHVISYSVTLKILNTLNEQVELPQF